jgi:hypothetical protein
MNVVASRFLGGTKPRIRNTEYTVTVGKFDGQLPDLPHRLSLT